jgi:DNA-binding beta-propeller fold protein YncE
VGPGGTAIVITPNGKTGYVAVPGNGTVVPFSVRTNTAGRPIRVGLGVVLAVTPDGRTLYVGTLNGPTFGTVIPISTHTGTAGSPITVCDTPQAIVFSRHGRPHGRTAYVLCLAVRNAPLEGAVVPISTATNEAFPEILIGKDGRDMAITHGDEFSKRP